METVAEEATRTSSPNFLPTAEWERHRTFIQELYITQNLPLKDVQRKVSERHQFNAS